MGVGSGGDYAQEKRWHSDKTTDVVIGTSTDYSANDGTAIVSVKSASHQLYVQKISIAPTTYAAVTWTFKDSAGTAVPLAHVSFAANAEAHVSESGTIVFDFGPKGYALTLGKNLNLDMSAAGVAGVIHVEAYEKLGTVISYLAGASSQ